VDRHLARILSWLLLLATTPALAQSPEPGISAKHHAWGRFRPGAWKLVRVVTETFDEHGNPTATTVTETHTSLAKIEDDGVLLEVEVGMEVAGRQFDGQPQRIKQGFHGEADGAGATLGPPTADTVEIENTKIPCRVQQIELRGTTSKTVAKVYYSDTRAPFLLRRDTLTTTLDGKEVLGETNMRVMALDMPCRILSEIRSTALVRIIQKHPKGTITTWAVTCPDVPGGIVSHSSKEVDKAGCLVRRGTLDLVGYGLKQEQEEERVGLFGRKRPVRRKSPPQP
jgi:hypothetical protein